MTAVPQKPPLSMFVLTPTFNLSQVNMVNPPSNHSTVPPVVLPLYLEPDQVSPPLLLLPRANTVSHNSSNNKVSASIISAPCRQQD